MSPDNGDADRLVEQVRTLPNRPGVYLFRDAAGDVLYVGKAKRLRSRVRSYLKPDPRRSLKLAELARRMRSVETFVVENESEALLLEWNLIKERSPRFNIRLRDDKSYPYVKVTVGEPFPRIFVTRRLRDDGARYFGPFTDVKAMRRALRTIKRMYTVRSCNYRMPAELPPRPCLDYHIGRCKAPCAGLQSEEEYREMIDEIVDILGGRTGPVRRSVEAKMKHASEQLEFERAAELRDVLRGLTSIESRQTAVAYRGGDHDVIGIAATGALACGTLLKVREGRLLGRQVHYLDNAEDATSAELLGALIKGFYLRQKEVPPALLVPEDFDERELVIEYMAARRDGPFEIRIVQRGLGRRLIEAAEKNAAHVLAQDRLERAWAEADGDPADDPRSDAPVAARRLAAALDLPAAPRTLVCFDVSTLGGLDTVGSCVWLEDGSAVRDEYRRFRIRALESGRTDDYAAMQEIVGRYFSRRVEESRQLPDLVVVDGGKGQLGAALQAMEASGVSDLPVVALAKREEEVFLPGRPEPLRLHRTDPGLHWLQRARDEAHRFALSYNRTLRRRRTLRSRLSEVPGIGPAREQELLRRFGSVDAILAAPEQELLQVPGIGPSTARRLRATLDELIS